MIPNVGHAVEVKPSAPPVFLIRQVTWLNPLTIPVAEMPGLLTTFLALNISKGGGTTGTLNLGKMRLAGRPDNMLGMPCLRLIALGAVKEPTATITLVKGCIYLAAPLDAWI